MNALVRKIPPRNDFLIPFEQVFDNFFNDFFKGTSTADKIKAQAGYPKMDILYENDNLIIRAAVPGVKEEDIQVEMLDEHTVQISGKVSTEEWSDNNYYLKELSRRSFTRQVYFEEKLTEPISAIVKDGILTLKWHFSKPKQPEKKLIKIQKG